MSPRKKLNEIQAYFDETQPLVTEPLQSVEPQASEDLPPENSSLSASLKLPKKAIRKIRFTLDLEKPLDERLNKAASKLNRSKADIVRIALERLLDELEAEWK